MKAFINDKILDLNQVKIPVLDRGYLFGEGLFETLRAYRGTLPFLKEHLERLEWASAFVGLPFPHPERIKNSAYALLSENNLKEGVVKILLSAQGDSIRSVALKEDPEINLVILCEKYKPIPQETYESGVDLCFLRSLRNEQPPLSTLKSTSWLSKMITARELEEKASFDGILFDYQDHVMETTRSNIFWVKDKTLYTPPLNSGLLPGITRKMVKELAEDNEIECKEKLIHGHELNLMDEVFITGSGIEIMPVTVVDREPIGEGVPGEMTEKFQDLYLDRLKQEIDREEK